MKQAKAFVKSLEDKVNDTKLKRRSIPTYPLFGDLADVDHLRSVIQEAAEASQPHQVLFVFQLKTKKIFNKSVFFLTVSVKHMLLYSIPRW